MPLKRFFQMFTLLGIVSYIEALSFSNGVAHFASPCFDKSEKEMKQDKELPSNHWLISGQNAL